MPRETRFHPATARYLPRRPQARLRWLAASIAALLLLTLGSCKQLDDFAAIGQAGTDASSHLADYYSQLEDTTSRTAQLSYFLDGLRQLPSSGDSQALYQQRIVELEKRRIFAVRMGAMYTSFSTLVTNKDQPQIESSVKDISSSLASMKAIKPDDHVNQAITGLLTEVDSLLRARKAEEIAPRMQAFNAGVVKFLDSEEFLYKQFNDEYADVLGNVGKALIGSGYVDPTPLLTTQISALGLTPTPGASLTDAARQGYENLVQLKGQQIGLAMKNGFQAIEGCFSSLSQAYTNLNDATSLSAAKSYADQAGTYLGLAADLTQNGASNAKPATGAH
jgi:hypothetical protein